MKLQFEIISYNEVITSWVKKKYME